MDMNQFMTHQLEIGTRQANALEDIAKALTKLSNVTCTAGELMSTVIVGDAVVEKAVVATGKKETTLEEREASREAANEVARQSSTKEAQEARRKEAAAAAIAEAEAAAAAAKAKEVDVPTVDQARAALKAYAAIEGNPAAMKLLEDFEAKSISELDPAKRAEFIKRCS